MRPGRKDRMSRLFQSSLESDGHAPRRRTWGFDEQAGETETLELEKECSEGFLFHKHTTEYEPKIRVV